LSDALHPGQQLTVELKAMDGQTRYFPVKVRIDTPIEIDYYKHGGILPFVLRQLLA
jgi:aconitate hydratase